MEIKVIFVLNLELIVSYPKQNFENSITYIGLNFQNKTRKQFKPTYFDDIALLLQTKRK